MLMVCSLPGRMEPTALFLCDNTTHHVVALDLSEGINVSSLSGLDDYDEPYIIQRLQGKTVSPSLLELEELTHLRLTFIDFNGTQIPEFLGSLGKLQYLNLSYCAFCDSVPHSLGNLSSLKFLDLSGIVCKRSVSEIDGTITSHMSPMSSNLEWLSSLQSLKYLNLSYISLSEADTWLQQINNLPLLQEIHFHDCYLPSALPISSLNHLANSANSLLVLDLSGNNMNISSVYPWLLTHKNSLSYLNLSHNPIEGGLPIFKIFKSLSHLDLSDTSLEYNFTDLVHLSHPDHLPRNQGDDLVDQNWSNLTFLDLSENKLQGELTHLITWLWDSTMLQHLDLSGGNNFFGSWPNMSRFQKLAHLNLENNHLNGAIEEDFFRLPNLKFLDLSGNNLGGSIPNPSACSSLELEYLDLSSNHLESLISDAHFHNLSKLKSLDLSFNSNITIRMNPSWNPSFQLDYLALSGCTLGPDFPGWLHNQSHISYLDISKAGIMDTIPNWFPNNSRLLWTLNMSYNQMHGAFPNLSCTDYLDLRFNKFNGTLPLSTIAKFGGELYLSNNSFSGNINDFVFPELMDVLDLSNNQLSGQISQDCWNHLLNVRHLNLANNNLSGWIQTNITGYCGIRSLHLRNNRFTGNFPSSLAICNLLDVLDLSNNQLSGQISQNGWNVLMGVHFLNLANNNLSGTIQTNVTHCDIRSLRIRNNSFGGHIPNSLAICSDLFDLDIGENYFTGSVPRWLGDSIPFLRVLSLRSNQLDGNLPSSLCNLSSMQLLDISRNNISGTIPKCFKNFLGMSSKSTIPDDIVNTFSDADVVSVINAKLTWKGHVVEYYTALWLLKLLDLSENNLSGEIPHEVTSLVELVSLNLSSNHLVGSIPPNISHLKNLDSLDLSRNNLSGGIPRTLSQLHQLGKFNLSSNNLSGKIPYDGHLDTFSNSSYLENPRLCGSPLSKICPEDVPKTRKPNFVDETVHEDMFKSIEFYISMLLGYIIFFWAVFGSLYFNRGWNRAILKAFTAVDDWLYVKVRMNKRRVERYFQK